MIWTEPTRSALRGYLSQFRRYYPGILEWCSRVEAGVSTGQRAVFIAMDQEEVAGLAITKNGHAAKLCHISVSPAARDRGLGRELMRIALRDMSAGGAKTIRVTTSEEVLRTHGDFFRTAGFRPMDWQVHRYRRGVSEVCWQLDEIPAWEPLVWVAAEAPRLECRLHCQFSPPRQPVRATPSAFGEPVPRCGPRTSSRPVWATSPR